MIRNIKEKLAGSMGSISGAASILGSWQVCHNICLGLIAALSVIGITLTGMPLAFFTKVAIPMWTIALILLIITFRFYIKKKCISKNLLLFNSGLILAGTPFHALQVFSLYLWIFGGGLALTGIGLFIRDKIHKKVGA